MGWRRVPIPPATMIPFILRPPERRYETGIAALGRGSSDLDARLGKHACAAAPTNSDDPCTSSRFSQDRSQSSRARASPFPAGFCSHRSRSVGRDPACPPQSDQPIVRHFVRHGMIEQPADVLCHLQIGAFAVAAHVILLARSSLLNENIQGAGVILDVKPVAHILPVAVDRQHLPFKAVQNEERDQLFWKMVRTIIVRTVGYQSRQAMRAMPRHDQMIRCRFAGGVWRARIIRGLLVEKALFHRSVDLVGRHVQEAGRIPRAPRSSDRYCRAASSRVYVPTMLRLDKVSRAGDRAIDMTFGREMHHGVGLEIGQKPRPEH